MVPASSSSSWAAWVPVFKPLFCANNSFGVASDIDNVFEDLLNAGAVEILAAGPVPDDNASVCASARNPAD